MKELKEIITFLLLAAFFYFVVDKIFRSGYTGWGIFVSTWFGLILFAAHRKDLKL